MTKSEMLTWIQLEFAPLVLATPAATILQQIDNAVRFWNTNSAHRAVTMVSLNGSAGVAGNMGQQGAQWADLDPQIKTVVNVIPSTNASTIFNDHPLFSLLGIVLLDNVTSDLIVMQEAYKTYKQYTSTNMAWHFEPNADPALGGRLYVRNLPVFNPLICVVGTKRILPAELTTGSGLVQQNILDWLLRYTKALTKTCEGNLLRKSDAIGVKNDGQVMVTEGMEEKKALEAECFINSRWVIGGKRM